MMVFAMSGDEGLFARLCAYYFVGRIVQRVAIFTKFQYYLERHIYRYPIHVHLDVRYRSG